MSEHKICLILKPGVAREHFERAATDAGFAYALTHTDPAGTSANAHEQVWAWPHLERPTAAVHYIESHLVSFSYVVVRGSEVPELAAKLTARLATYSHAELIDDAMSATEHDQQVYAINRLAMGFVRSEPAVFGIMTNYILGGATPLLREAAVNALGFHGWPEVKWLVEKIAAEDPHDNVRARAAALLSAWPN